MTALSENGFMCKTLWGWVRLKAKDWEIDKSRMVNEWKSPTSVMANWGFPMQF